MYCVSMARTVKLSALLCAVLLICLQPAHAAFDRSQLDALSGSFWQWRATQQPFTNDDIPRIERAATFVVDWTPAAARRYQAQIVEFLTEKGAAPSHAKQQVADASRFLRPWLLD